MKKILLLFTFLQITIPVICLAEDFSFGSITTDNWQQKPPPFDPDANALVLNEFGKSYITEQADKIVLIHEYHVRIKLFNSSALEKGNIEIALQKENSEYFDQVRDIQAITYNQEDGAVTQLAVDPKKIFEVSVNKYRNITKFAMPGLKPGCIIEYKYAVITPFLFNFRTWEFQDDIPKLRSEYKAEIPAVYNYNVVLRGSLKLTKTKSDVQRDCFIDGGTKCDCSDLTYIMENIPAFKTEEYMTSPKNFLSAIYFELSDYVSLRNGNKVKVSKEWADVDRSLMSSENFGSQIKRSGLMKDRIKDVLAGKNTDLSKANAIYAFVQKNIKWNGFYGKYSDDGIRVALNNHTGTIGDINLTLIAALNAAGLKTDAVLLSTREHGQVGKLFPTESDFNYVIAKTQIAGTSYFLDATDQLMGFGMLPMRCLNDQGRVLSLDKPSYWIDIFEPIKRSEIESLNLILQNDGKFKGTFMRYTSGYDAYEKRNAIKKFNSVEEYVESIAERQPRLKILKSNITNLDSLDQTLKEEYEIELKGYDNLDNDKLVLNPFMLGSLTVNPFKLNDRNFPVDLGMASDDRYILTLHLPQGYEVENAPQKIGLSLPNNAGVLLSDVNATDGEFTFSQVMKLAKPVYAPEEYPYLKELFNKKILSEKTEIVLRKKAK